MIHIINKSWIIFFILIMYFIEIAIYTSVLKWIERMENMKCECSNTRPRFFIKHYMLFYILFSTVLCIYNIYLTLYDQDKYGLSFKYQIPFSMIWFLNVIVSIQYIEYLKKINCQCSDDFIRYIYEVYCWFRVAIIILYSVSFTIMISFLIYRKLNKC